MRLISWNINFRINCVQHVTALAVHNPDMVALQEVNPNCLLELRDKLSLIGLGHIINNASLVAESDRKHYCGLIASRWPVTPLSQDKFEVPFPESVLSAIFSTPEFNLEIHSVHVPPGSSHGSDKIKTFDGVYKYLTQNTYSPRILCGDFNSPRLELPNGQVFTWGQTERGNIKKGREGWDTGERSVIQGLAVYDLIDTFRLIHGYEKQEFSIAMKHKDKMTYRRFDHVFASKILNPIACCYLHELRVQGLSDHAPLKVDFSPIYKQ